MGTRNLPPKGWMLGTEEDTHQQETAVGESEVNLETCAPLAEDGSEASLSLTAFKGELDSAVTQYLSQVKDLGYKGTVDEGTKDQKLLAVKFKLDPEEIKPRSSSEETADGKEAKPKIKVISREDKGEQTQLEVELPSLDNPLYITLSECSTGLFEHLEEGELEDSEEVDEATLTFEHYYENGQVGSEDEHIYENVDNSNGEEEEEHLYDTLPRPKPDVPPKPDFLAQLTARQSEPVKRAWNPFVNLNVDTDETPSFSTASSLSSPSSDNSGELKLGKKRSNPFLTSRPRETNEQTLILDGSETSDLGSSGGEDEVRSVEDWPLPPTPPPGEGEIIEEDDPLPPPPPELALQELEEAVIREEEEERKLALQREKEAIERDYGAKSQDYEPVEKVEAVNETLTSLEDTYATPCKKKKQTKKPITKEPKIIQIDDDDYEDFNTPAIRHSVIIALKDSIPSIPQSIKPSEIRRKESLKRSESLRKVGLFKPKDSKHHIERRESIFKLFPQTVKSEGKVSSETGSVSVGVVSPKQESPPFEFVESRKSADQIIEISEDGSWEMKNSMDYDSANQTNKSDIDPFTGIPIMAPPLSPVSIPAPPSAFQTNDGTDGVFSADIVTTHSGPSSLASTITDSISGDLVPPATPTLLCPSEAIQEESPQETENMNTQINGNMEESTRNASVTDSPASQQKNIGAAIMESYEHELQKKKDSMNLPEVSLLEFGDSVRDLEEQRKSVIKQMTVKAKKKDTWIKTCHMHAKGNEEAIPVAPSRARRKNSPSRPDVCETAPPVHERSNGHSKEEIVENIKQVEVDLPNIASIIETINGSIDQSQIGMLQKGPEEPKAPQKVSRKHKKPTPKVDPVPVNTDKSDAHEPSIEEVISPKNTEVLAAFFSSPVKTAKVPEENLTPPLPLRAKEVENIEQISESLAENLVTEVPEDDSVCSDVSIGFKHSDVKLEKLISVDDSLPVEKMNGSPSKDLLDTCSPVEADFEEDPLVKEKNAINVGHSVLAKVEDSEISVEFEKGNRIEPQINNDIPPEPAESNEVNGMAAVPDLLQDEGEVEYFSILDNKSATKTYWETRMLATMDDGGWESVANVRFQPVPGVTPVVVQGEESIETVTPPPEFIPAPPPQFDNSPVDSEGSAPPSLDDALKEQSHPEEEDPLPAKQYVYGVNDQVTKEKHGARVVETLAKKPSSQENVIEAEIMAQQLKEVELRQEVTLKNAVLREKGASSPASHDSDEGFVDRLGEDVTTVSSNGYGSHGLRDHDSERVIYNAVSPPPEYFGSGSSTPTPSSNTETKIALEIRELKEREEELKRMRTQLTSSRDTLNEDEESRSSASRENLLEDHFTSFTTTTDEGNYSECGDAVSSEDKSSDGSNSRIMSPELLHPGTHLDFSRRKVTVKPFEDEEEDQPVYTRMQKESVIEREIRLAREREEAFRREKGLLQNSNNAITHRPNNNNNNNNILSSRPSAFSKEDPRDVQHRMATSRIQLEIQETCEKEKELRDAGKILTTSEETVDAKVTRMSDFTDISQIDSAWSRTPTSSSTASSPSPRCQSVNGPTPSLKRSPSPRSPSSPVPTFNLAPPPSRGMTKSLSTTNLASPTTPTGVRAPKGLMQKFIASRGKMTTSAFSSPPPNNLHLTSTSRGIPTRPMRVEPKQAAVLQREPISRLKPAEQTNGTAEPSPVTNGSQAPQPFRRSYCTAEEKIQLELREMQQREEELRRHRARLLAQSQPNLAGIAIDGEDFDAIEDTTDSIPEMNGLRAVLSNPNLLEDEPEQTQAVEKGVRRRSALIAQWENRIQKADT